MGWKISFGQFRKPIKPVLRNDQMNETHFDGMVFLTKSDKFTHSVLNLAVAPPSTTNAWPVMNDDWVESARK